MKNDCTARMLIALTVKEIRHVVVDLFDDLGGHHFAFMFVIMSRFNNNIEFSVLSQS